MTIRITTTVEDCVAWNLYRLYRTPTGRRQLLRHYTLLVGGAWLVVSVLLLWLFGSYWSIGTSIGISAAVLIGYATLAAATARSSMARATRKLVKKGKFPYVKGEVTITPRPEGWCATWPDGESRRNWSALQTVSEIEGYIVLHWSTGEFSMIPDRVFTSTEERLVFLAVIERYRLAGEELTGSESLHAIPTTTGQQWYRDRYQVESEDQAVRNEVRGAP